MKILFLDIDGVLNSVGWWKRRPKLSPMDKIKNDQQEVWARRNLDPAAIARLQRIVDATDCMVVVSSTWRTLLPLPKLTNYLRAFGGFRGHLFGATPELEHVPGEPFIRGKEIAAWLDKGPLIRTYCVIDDDSVPDHNPYFIQTSVEEGITDEDVEIAIEILNADPIAGQMDDVG